MTEHAEFIPVEGRSVVYQLAEGEWRPAQIVKVWTIDGGKACNLVVFVDGTNDAVHVSPLEAPNLLFSQTIWRTSVVLGDRVNQYLPRKPVG